MSTEIHEIASLDSTSSRFQMISQHPFSHPSQTFISMRLQFFFTPSKKKLTFQTSTFMTLLRSSFFFASFFFLVILGL